ncbi:MAG: DUF4132 domain-containing protein [Planctomycetota bacterium]
MSKLAAADRFVVPPDSPLREAHAAVEAFVEAVVGTWGRRSYYDLTLKDHENGLALHNAKPPEARQLVLAAVEQCQHWDRIEEEIRAEFDAAGDGVSPPRREPVWDRRRCAYTVVASLMRRKLPFDRGDIVALVGWVASMPHVSTFTAPVGYLTKAVTRYAESGEVDDELASLLGQMAIKLRNGRDPDTRRHATTIDQLIGDASGDDGDEPEASRRPPPAPGSAGNPAVLSRLKAHLGIGDGGDAEEEMLDPDRFPLRVDSPLAPQHRLLSEYFEDAIAGPGYHRPNPAELAHGEAITGAPDETAASFFLAAAERQINSVIEPELDYQVHGVWQSRHTAAATVALVRATGLPWRRGEAFDAMLFASVNLGEYRQLADQTIEDLVAGAERFAEQSPLTEGERYTLLLLRAGLVNGPLLGSEPEIVMRASRLVGDGARFCLAPGEAWADAVNHEFSSWSKTDRKPWVALFTHLLTANSSRPSKSWLKKAAERVQEIGAKQLAGALARWLPLVAKGRSLRQLGGYAGDTRGAADTMIDENATALRGLLWIVPTLDESEEMTRLVTDVTLSAYKKTPGVGPRAVKVGNAGVYALSQLGTIDAVGQLAVLKVRVKFGTAQKEIEKAFTKTAEALGLPRDEIEEMGVPSYGLTEIGRLEESVGDYRAEIVVTGAAASLNWSDAKDKPLKSVPAKVRKEHADDLKELKQSLKDINALLPAQRDRIDSMFLAERTWPFAAWRERYLNHPLVGPITRRLLWSVDGVPASWQDGAATTVAGEPLEHGETAEIALWHPVGRPVDEVMAWRERLETLAITQPFKQAHREVYLLTAAEENTGTYSNRFAAHVIRQHQFNALCGARGWKNQLRLMVDDECLPPTRQLPAWGLRAEFWVEGIGENYGADTNEAGSYFYLATDQVRFYRAEAAENSAHATGGGYGARAAGPGDGNVNEPLPLSEVPPLVFSEVMRDVDLFVGVASVGNDPTWADGGPGGAHREYWTDYAFGDLSNTANTRKAVLQRLVPRLAIADRCSFSDRFLEVLGELRTYKIHLGSGNILMKPNDQYLCIVPDSRPKSNPGDLYLPFEGDRTLSIILSKALLLAADKKIKDPTILQQINR